MSGVERIANAEAQKRAGKRGDAQKTYEQELDRAADVKAPVKK